MIWPRTRTPVALLNLLSQPTRTIVSVAGVTFALLLIFMQLGFLGAVANTATVLYRRLPFDLLIRSPEYLQVYEPRSISRNWLDWSLGQGDIVDARPFWSMLQRWRSPRDGQSRAIAVLGEQLDRPVIELETLEQLRWLLSDPNRILIDESSRADFGPINGRHFTEQDIGTRTDLGARQVEVAGLVKLGTGLAANGQVLLSAEGFANVAPWDARKSISLGLLTLREGARPEQVAQRLRQRLGEMGEIGKSVSVMTRQEALEWERKRWINDTPIGAIFQMGVLLAMFVGGAVVYQVLATDIANRLPEYATLKAMGYGPMYLAGLVLRQAWAMSVLSFLPAWLLAELLYRLTAWAAGIEITMTTARLLGVAALGLAMCTFSGLLAIRKLSRAEPASLF